MYENSWRKDFPILNNLNMNDPWIYLDSSSTTLKPRAVIEAVSQFYTYYTSNVSRSKHFIAEHVHSLFERARKNVAEFINADEDEIIFTQNCTDAINLVANGLRLNKEDEVIVSILEHHSNFLPWREKATLKIVPALDGIIDTENLKKQITKKTKLIAMTYLSNVTGNVQPIREIATIANENNILCLVDAAQAAAHMPIDVAELGCDFLSLAAHKLLGPSGVGILYAKRDAAFKLNPSRFGGGMVRIITANNKTLMDSPLCFEAGTSNIEGILGLSAAIDYINAAGKEKIFDYMKQLETYGRLQLMANTCVVFPFEMNCSRAPIFTFRPKNPHIDCDMVSAKLSDRYKIAIRNGYHCAQPLYRSVGLDGAIRASFYLYNTYEEVDLLNQALEEICA